MTDWLIAIVLALVIAIASLVILTCTGQPEDECEKLGMKPFSKNTYLCVDDQRRVYVP